MSSYLILERLGAIKWKKIWMNEWISEKVSNYEIWMNKGKKNERQKIEEFQIQNETLFIESDGMDSCDSSSCRVGIGGSRKIGLTIKTLK